MLERKFLARSIRFSPLNGLMEHTLHKEKSGYLHQCTEYGSSPKYPAPCSVFADKTSSDRSYCGAKERAETV